MILICIKINLILSNIKIKSGIVKYNRELSVVYDYIIELLVLFRIDVLFNNHKVCQLLRASWHVPASQ